MFTLFGCAGIHVHAYAYTLIHCIYVSMIKLNIPYMFKQRVYNTSNFVFSYSSKSFKVSLLERSLRLNSTTLYMLNCKIVYLIWFKKKSWKNCRINLAPVYKTVWWLYIKLISSLGYIVNGDSWHMHMSKVTSVTYINLRPVNKAHSCIEQNAHKLQNKKRNN